MSPHGGRRTGTNARHSDHGFTMIELMLVMLVIVLIMGVSIPRLWPVIAFAGLEGQAHHLANYGRAAMSYCTLMRENFVVKVDLNEQRYWAERVTVESLTRFLTQEQGPLPPLEPLTAAGTQTGEEIDAEERAHLMRLHMETFVRRSVEVRAANVVHESEGFLSDIGPDFNEFTLEKTDEEDEVVRADLLEPATLPSDVRLESVRIGDRIFTTGLVEIEILPLGMTEHVVFYLKGSEGDYYTVMWDAITGGARIYAGKEENP